MADSASRSGIVKLERDNARLRARSAELERPKPLRRIFLEFVFGGSLITASIGGGYAYLIREDPHCKWAHEVMLDDALNRDIAEPVRKDYIEKQMRIAEACDKDRK